MEPEAGKDHRKFPRLVIGNSDQMAENYSQKKFILPLDEGPRGQGALRTRHQHVSGEDIMPYGNYCIAEALRRRLRGDGQFPAI
jgi:hypothetical protein